MKKQRTMCALLLIYLLISVPALATDGQAASGWWSHLSQFWQQLVATFTWTSHADEDGIPMLNPDPDPEDDTSEFAPFIVPNG